MATLVDSQKPRIKNELPIVPLRDTVVFPSSMVPITVGRQKVKLGLDGAWSADRLVVFVSQKNPRVENPAPNDIYSVGTVGLLRRLWKVDNEYNLAVEGLSRVYLKEFTQIDPYLAVKVEEIPELSQKNDEIEALFRSTLAKIKKYGELGGILTLESSIHIFSTDDPNQLVNIIAASIDLKTSDKQQILEMVDTKARLQRLSDLLTREIRILEISSKIDTETQERVGKVTKEAILREKMKSIEKELGEDDDSREISEFKKKIKSACMPEDVKTKADRELSRLAKMSSYNPESSYIRTYLEWLVDLPWQITDKKKADVEEAAKILDEDHYGLPKVKERILEYLAVHKLVGKIRGPILCFNGPPGVGKTSIGRSIARALGRKFVRVSLGGIHDEAEIRGHRRTYVGALPGRIIQGIKSAGTKNPVFMLDEIDKVGVDFRGDPSSALLEALDPEQNNSFSDHYLEVAYDLSDVMFITTANILDTIPPALRDRLEVINFPGYTEEEKFQIAKSFLIPKQLESHGLNTKQAEISDAALKEIISRYTREAGVRELEREIAAVFRKVAKKIATKKKQQIIRVSPKQLHSYLGAHKFSKTIAETKDEIGMATGLYVTAAGGGILFIEVNVVSGKGQLILTGQLGDVMKESAQAALSYVRSRAKVLGLSENLGSKFDLHIHVPEGGVPKDGPSAGIAMTTALVSALTRIPARKEVGMTGEVTLRGRVLEIGGVKEKVLAARRAGLTTIILPKANSKDLEDIPKNVRKDLQFILAEHMDEVLKVALTKALPKEKSSEAKKSKLVKDRPNIPASPVA
ncbi:endopeptidase La [Candidatus Curtissbacteria bacterium RIFCSPLOWO2_01_FULL_39_62]|uniref:Lon protease n=3 Tax=Microgenomates group TaxID=1794810 RepID=A0A1F5G757_9BACT|nr:MAG: Lon protease [Candidatus Woesebacteria bacterium GW2011_GWA1_39_8]OGD83406.1 MAG: endopeptidase La [Candidatus Curtissbacteria bacterium RIFCSPHIGHO2_01_FULL_39_57]OGD87655.1 MAG: endopeptidase La [Candidatus Curtissbacteria bacterium RIFCSPHIGHO2_02_FULL_40_16b]OGD90138.1 MAG: endopeptidase La [Candidatus Curtissbacteria bacterium RIFCSPHIGHO2_12_FULL_38_37]OGE00442.1 MAG: endopeptidase La [Candidatus Curtissbacteria bacterium RIFCSPLOWO2_01_FULL_39_62]OGE14156.1 MAG: endopeptidase La